MANTDDNTLPLGMAYDWYIERKSSGNIFKAEGYTEEEVKAKFEQPSDLIFQKIDGTGQAVALTPPVAPPVAMPAFPYFD